MIRREDIDRAVKRLKIIGEHTIADILEEVADELEQAIDDLHGLCSMCRHNNTKVCDSCTHTASIFEVYGDADNWEWRGNQDARE